MAIPNEISGNIEDLIEAVKLGKLNLAYQVVVWLRRFRPEDLARLIEIEPADASHPTYTTVRIYQEDAL